MCIPNSNENSTPSALFLADLTAYVTTIDLFVNTTVIKL